MFAVKRERVRRLVAAALVVALGSAAACSRDDDPVVTEPTGDGETTETTAVGIEAALDAGDFGTLEGVCGPAPEGETLVATGSQGVTADSIEIGTISDIGFFARPGLGQEMLDATKVFVRWCNELGGIYGREIVSNERDAAFSNYQTTIIEACLTDFALVGGGSTNDSVGQSDRVTCMLPDIPSFHASLESRGSDLAWQPEPLPPDALQFGIATYLAETFPGTTDSVGILYGNNSGSIVLGTQFRAAGEELGWTVEYEEQYNATGESTFSGYAARIRDSGVKGLMLLGDNATMALVITELANIGYELDWILGGKNSYDTLLIDVAAASLDQTPLYVWTANVPFELREDSVALQQYFSLFEEYNPEGRAQASLGISTFNAWLLFATAAKECGVELTRRCLHDQLEAITEWDGGGLTSTNNPADQEPAPCYVPLLATSSGFEVAEFEPNEGLYTCDPANVAVLDPSFRDNGTTLEEVGLTIDDLE